MQYILQFRHYMNDLEHASEAVDQWEGKEGWSCDCTTIIIVL